MATARPPGGGLNARIGVDLSQLKAMPAAARAAGQATARELQNALKQAAAQQAAVENQRTAAMQAALTQRRVAVRAAAREEIEAARQVAAQQAAVERQRMAEMKAALRQRVVAVKAAAREEAAAQRASQVSAAAFRGGVASFAGAAFGGPLGGLAGAVAGGPGGLALAAGLAVSQGARAAVEATQTATAYNRQELASRNLAGSQAKLNELLSAYTQASGGAVDKASALAAVTRLQATGFADNAKELDRFTRGVRGASIAMGKGQDEIGQEVQLAISNQSFKRLDQIGLGIQEVNDRIAELRAANKGMTREAAFQEAVLGLLNDKFGGLTTSVQGQATGLERLSAAWKDFGLNLGQNVDGSINKTTNQLARLIDHFNQVEEARRKAFESGDFTAPSGATRGVMMGTEKAATQRFVSATNNRDWDALAHGWIALRTALGIGGQTVAMYNAAKLLERGGPIYGPRGDSGYDSGRVSAPAAIEGTGQVKLDWMQGIEALTRQTNAAIIAEETSFGLQRASVVANYNKSMAREAEDFGRSRANAERKLQMSILDVAQDSARQRVKWEADLARNIAEAQADSAERISDARRDTGKRLAELDEDFKEDQARREEDFRDDMLSAAGRLDAIALLELRKGRARELEDSKKAHDEQRTDLQAQLQERITEESENLAERIQDTREAHQRQVQEQAENDRLRIQEMKDAFAEQTKQEDIERGIRIRRQAEDYAAQLVEMDAAHGLRLNQMRTHAIQERIALDEKAKADLAALGVRNAAYDAIQDKKELAAEKRWDRYMGHIDKTLTDRLPESSRRARRPGELTPYASGGYVGATGPALLHRGEFVLSPAMLAGNMPIPAAVSSAVTHNSSRSIVVERGAIVLHAAPGTDNAELVGMLDAWLVSRLEQMAGSA